MPKRTRERGGSTGGGDDSGSGIRSPGGFADPSTPDSSDSCGITQQQQQSLNNSSQQQQQQQQRPDAGESRQLAIYDTILTVSQAHHAHCAYTEEKTRNIARTPIAVLVSQIFNSYIYIFLFFFYLKEII